MDAESQLSNGSSLVITTNWRDDLFCVNTYLASDVSDVSDGGVMELLQWMCWFLLWDPVMNQLICCSTTCSVPFVSNFSDTVSFAVEQEKYLMDRTIWVGNFWIVKYVSIESLCPGLIKYSRKTHNWNVIFSLWFTFLTHFVMWATWGERWDITLYRPDTLICSHLIYHQVIKTRLVKRKESNTASRLLLYLNNWINNQA